MDLRLSIGVVDSFPGSISLKGEVFEILSPLCRALGRLAESAGPVMTVNASQAPECMICRKTFPLGGCGTSLELRGKYPGVSCINGFAYSQIARSLTVV